MNQESEEGKVMKGEADERIKVYEVYVYDVFMCMKYHVYESCFKLEGMSET